VGVAISRPFTQPFDVYNDFRLPFFIFKYNKKLQSLTKCIGIFIVKSLCHRFWVTIT
jgi:hypothetical protein